MLCTACKLKKIIVIQQILKLNSYLSVIVAFVTSGRTLETCTENEADILKIVYIYEPDPLTLAHGRIYLCDLFILQI